MARHFVGDPADQLRQLGYGAEHLDALLVEQLSDLRQLEPGRVTPHQPDTDPVFQPPERVADARLLEVEAFAGARDALFLRDHDKGAQQVPVEFPDQLFGAWHHS